MRTSDEARSSVCLAARRLDDDIAERPSVFVDAGRVHRRARSVCGAQRARDVAGDARREMPITRGARGGGQLDDQRTRETRRRRPPLARRRRSAPRAEHVDRAAQRLSGERPPVECRRQADQVLGLRRCRTRRRRDSSSPVTRVSELRTLHAGADGGHAPPALVPRRSRPAADRRTTAVPATRGGRSRTRRCPPGRRGPAPARARAARRRRLHRTARPSLRCVHRTHAPSHSAATRTPCARRAAIGGGRRCRLRARRLRLPAGGAGEGAGVGDVVALVADPPRAGARVAAASPHERFDQSGAPRAG